MNNFVKGLLHGIAVFVLMYGATLVSLIPHQYTDITVGAIIAGIIAWIGHSVSTPATQV